MTILTIENLDVRYGQFKAVRSASLKVGAGEIVALIGANGAGKTTLLRSLAGAIKPAEGRIVFKDRDVTSLAAHERVKAGMVLVPEGRRLFARMTVEENLALGGLAGRGGDWSVDRIFSIFPNLVKRRHAKTATLSGGEQQATAIGRALMTNPEVIFFDEISLGLSPLVVDQVYASLAELLKSGVTIVLVEQDLKRAMTVAARAVCMLEGQIVLDRPMAEATREEITQAYFGLRHSSTEGEAHP
jgi:branched-chain amino acid transport system ATP-binding protein